MEISRPLLFAALALSIGSAATSAFLALRTPAALPSAAPQGSCACDDAALRRELADLRKQITTSDSDAFKRLSARVAALENKAGAAVAQEDPPEETERARTPPPPIPPPPVLPLKAYKSFDVPNAHVSVRQDSSGALVIVNTDPAMTGKSLPIIARGEDGSSKEVTIVVPPP